MEEGEKEYMLQIQHICKEYRTDLCAAWTIRFRKIYASEYYRRTGPL